MKLSAPLAIGVVVAALIIIVTAGVYYMRQATGAAVADDIHAYMRKQPPGVSPVSRDQIEQMKRQHSANAAPAAGAR
jgi:hypothetical protein